MSADTVQFLSQFDGHLAVLTESGDSEQLAFLKIYLLISILGTQYQLMDFDFNGNLMDLSNDIGLCIDILESEGFQSVVNNVFRTHFIGDSDYSLEEAVRFMDTSNLSIVDGESALKFVDYRKVHSAVFVSIADNIAMMQFA